ncbi:MAG: AAA family ATPase, partial [Actinomycetota bacterium]
MIRLVIADENVKFIELTKDKLKGLKGLQILARVTKPDELRPTLKEYPASVLLFGPSWAKRSSLATVEEISVSFPNISAILIADSLSTELLREAMRAGVKDVLPRTVEPRDLCAAVARADELSQHLRESSHPEAGATSKEESLQAGKTKVITLLGTKGGVGKSFIAANLAICLAKETRKKVILLDLDLQYGDIPVILKLFPKHTIYDVVDNVDRLDAEMMRSFLTAHSSGISVLASPLEPRLADAISEAHVRKIIKVLKSMTDYLVIDTSANLDDKVLATVAESDDVFVVASMDVPSVKNAKLALQALEPDLLAQNGQSARLILNRSDSRVGLESEHVEEALKTRIYASVPSSRQVPLSVNRG